MNDAMTFTSAIRAIWMQRFRRQPLSTVVLSVLAVLLLVGFLFLSAFITITMLLIGGAVLLYQRIMRKGPWARGGDSRLNRFTFRREVYTAQQNTPSIRQQRDVIEGDYEEVDTESSSGQQE